MSLLTYARAAVPLVPGASRLPFVAGRGDDVPRLERTREGVRVDPERLAAYARVCGFRVRDELPATYPHVLAFPLHLELMTDGRFPFPALGLVHVANRIALHRPLHAGEPLDLRVHTTPLAPHPRGRTFALVSEARTGGELAWEEQTTILRRGAGAERGEREPRAAPPPATAEWSLPGDLGRRYAAVSGDSNPIHLHPLTARLFGFPRAIAHGMWTAARCLAALEPTLPDAYAVAVAFRRPILLPARVAFGAQGARFGVRDARREDVVHLEGTVEREAGAREAEAG
jgi:acyl dehydratase